VLDTLPIFKEELTNLIKDQLGGIQMSFFNRKKNGDRRSDKNRRKSPCGLKKRSEVDRRSGTDRRMSLYDRLPEDQQKTVEIIIEHLERKAC
jgi:hypothetical protein